MERNSHMDYILLLLYKYYPFEDANTNVLLPLIERIKRENKIIIVTCNVSRRERKHEVIDGVDVYRFKRNLNWFFKLKYDDLNQIKDRRKRKVAKIAKKIFLFGRRNQDDYSFPEDYKWNNNMLRLTKRLIKKKKIKKIIAFSAPFSTQNIVYKLRKTNIVSSDVELISYFTDPYAEYIEYRDSREKRMRREHDIYEIADKIIVTPEMYEANNVKNELKIFLHKTFSVPLLNIEEKLSPRAEQREINNQRYECVFLGSFNSRNIRDPKYLFETIKFINDFDKIVTFRLIVNSWDDETNNLFQDILHGCNNVIVEDRKPLHECKEIMRNADILLNVGNKCINQLPSKIFDYMNTGKPIVNFYDTDMDPAIKYLFDYPLCLQIESKSDFQKEDGVSFVNFVKKAAHGIVSQKQVHEIYQKFELDSAVDKAEYIINLERKRETITV